MHHIVLKENGDDSLAIQASKALIDLESYKAELRGKPRIKAQDAPPATHRAQRPLTIRDAKPAPIESSKESLGPADPSPHHHPDAGTGSGGL
jgi:hypothetical protein